MKVFVSCVSQKYGEIQADISKINQPTLKETFEEWKNLTEGGKIAGNVYKGTQWNITKTLNELIPTYVISAGYGIITPKDLIVPYSITFSDAYVGNKHLLVPKFDLSQKEANKEWFNMFGDYSHLWDTDEVLIFTVNPLYLNVLDLPKKDNIIVLNDYKLGRLAKWLGTGVNTLNIKFTEYLIKNHPNISGNTELKELVNELEDKNGEDLYQKREKVSDDFITNFIKSGNTLKSLRENGYSCSTQRFQKLKSNLP